MSKKIIVHVGMPKAGSTYLQRHIFPRLRGTYAANARDGSTSVFRQIKRSNPLFFAREPARQTLRQLIERVDETAILFSNEDLFGDAYENFTQNAANAQTIKALLPSASIFLVVRRQDAFLSSMYKQTLHEGHSVSPAAFINFRGNAFSEYRHNRINIDLRSLNLTAYVKNYMDVFGRDNVCVLPFEWLMQKQEVFFARFFAFANLETQPVPPLQGPINRGYSATSAAIARVLNKWPRVDGSRRLFIDRPPHWAGSLARSRRRIPRALGQIGSQATLRNVLQKGLDRIAYVPFRPFAPSLNAAIVDYFRADNQRLAELLGLDLERLGYF